MAGRWRVIGPSAVTKKTDQQKRYTPQQVEQMLHKAARAAGIDEAKIGPVVSQFLPGKRTIAKSTREIEAERRSRQEALQRDLEEQRAERVAKMRDGGERLSRTLARNTETARGAVTFAHSDGTEMTYAGDGAVTRLDLSPDPVAKRATDLFADLVDAPTTEPYTFCRRDRR
jgi:DNA-binding transcriptional MerR regulator